jgi:uncharacterized RDD family membrane protein YckC
MEIQNLDIPQGQYASFGRRFLALLLDFMILFIPASIMGQIVPVVGSLVVWFFYTPMFESSELRATLGKHLMGIQVTDAMGRRVSFRTSLIRNVLKIISSALCFFGYLIALFTSKRQTLHDLLAETLVVYGRSERPIADAWLESVRDLFQATPLATGSLNSSLSQLERLQELRNSGALTEEEFQAQKAKILK